MRSKVLLFDIDGVLVCAEGYGKARRDAVQYFIDQMDWKILAPDDGIFALLESYGVTSEWDMVPILVAILLEAAWEQGAESNTSSTLEEAFGLVRKKHLPAREVDYAAALHSFKPLFALAVVPSEALLEACAGENHPEVFPHIRRQPFLEELLGHTRAIRQSATFRVIQNLVLGGGHYTRAYQLPPLIQTDSYLEKYDRPLLLPEVRAALMRGVEQGLVSAAALTARPSLPPREISLTNPHYTPEAEMALKVVGLPELPLIGYGRMQYLAFEKSTQPDSLTKPSPVQALAALRAALTGEEWPALQWAYAAAEAIRNGQVSPMAWEGLPQSIELHVFEDTPAGVLSVRNAVPLLEKLGVYVQWQAWGIATHPEKAAALKELGARIYADVNPAILAALSQGDI